MTVDRIADYLVPDRQVWKEFGVTPMTGWRWTHDPELGFPPAIHINGRNYRSRQQLEAFKARLIAEALQSKSDSAAMREAYGARRQRRRERSLKRKQTA
jgi:hypothetical protein